MKDLLNTIIGEDGKFYNPDGTEVIVELTHDCPKCGKEKCLTESAVEWDAVCDDCEWKARWS